MLVMEVLAFLLLFGILDLRFREVVSPLPDLPIEPLDYEEATSLLSRKSSFKEMFKDINC